MKPAEFTRWQRRQIARADRWQDATGKDQVGRPTRAGLPKDRRAWRSSPWRSRPR